MPDARVRMRGTAGSSGMTTTAASPGQEACGIGAMSGTTAKGGGSCSARARCLCCAGTIRSTGPTVLQACTPRSAAQRRRGQDLRWATCGEIRRGHRPRGEAVVRRAAGGLVRNREIRADKCPGRLGWRRQLVFRPPSRRQSGRRTSSAAHEAPIRAWGCGAARVRGAAPCGRSVR
jgi:hypothetical protein